MAKDLTVKDVFYALEYLGDALIRISIRDGRARWQMRDSGMPVKEGIANEVCASGKVEAFAELSRQIVKWRVAA